MKTQHHIVQLIGLGAFVLLSTFGLVACLFTLGRFASLLWDNLDSNNEGGEIDHNAVVINSTLNLAIDAPESVNLKCGFEFNYNELPTSGGNLKSEDEQ